MNIVGRRKLFFTIPAVIIVVGIIMMFVSGFNLDIDFSGGTEITANMVKMTDNTDKTDATAKAEDKGTPIKFTNDEIKKFIEDKSGHAVSTVQKAGKSEVLVKLTDHLSDEDTINLKKAFVDTYGLAENEISITSVSATIGNEMVGQSLLLCIITVILMLLYITMRFELKFGVCSVVALVHDVLIMLTFYALFRIPVNTSFIAAILTIIGYSINATIVVFDRIRESMRLANKKTDVEEVANKSIVDTLTRSINTSVTTLITVVLLYIFGVDSLKAFTLPIMVGIIAGTYSSVFIAGPLWALWKVSGKKSVAKATK